MRRFLAVRPPGYVLRLHFAGVLFLLPTLLFAIVFLIGPIAVAGVVSFTKYSILSAPQFNGGANYLAIAKMPAFWESLYVTGKYIFLRLALIFAIAFFMAHIVQTRILGAGVFQSIYFLPYVFPLAVTSVVWKIFFQARGLMESLKDLLGIEPISWMTDGDWALVAILVTTVWSGVGYYSIILLAGLQTIPKSVWEASVVDGLTAPQRFIDVTLPMLRPTLFYMSKRFGRSPLVIRDLSLDIDHGEFLVLVGPSGCGKSTTLRMLAGLETITEGEVLIDGRRVNELHPRDRDIAMVFQNYALYPHMSVRQNMALNLKVRRVERDEIVRRVDHAARILGIETLLDRRPSELSGGQKQRVAVGRAIVREPKVFLFDEPLSNLDAKLRVQMRAEIGGLHARLGATMVYVTHDQVEAMTLGSRIAVMLDGAIQQVASPLELFNEPASIFVAGFIGSPPMNFVSGAIRRGDGLRFASTDGAVACDAPPALETYADREVVLGIRPEYLRPAAPQDSLFEASLSRVEPLGSELILYLEVGSSELICRIPADTPLGDRALHLACSTETLRFFDPSTRRRIGQVGT